MLFYTWRIQTTGLFFYLVAHRRVELLFREWKSLVLTVRRMRHITTFLFSWRSKSSKTSFFISIPLHSTIVFPSFYSYWNIATYFIIQVTRTPWRVFSFLRFHLQIKYFQYKYQILTLTSLSYLRIMCPFGNYCTTDGNRTRTALSDHGIFLPL